MPRDHRRRKDGELPEDREELRAWKDEVIRLLELDHTLQQVAEKLDLTVSGNKPLAILKARRDDSEFDRRCREAMYGTPDPRDEIPQRYGVTLDDMSLNTFLATYRDTGSRADACFAAGIRPSTLLKLTNPEHEDYHPEFDLALKEEEQYQLLEVRDKMMRKAKGGDAVSQRFVLSRLDPDFTDKRPKKEKSHVPWSTETLSHAADSLSTLAKKARERKSSEARDAGEVPGSGEGAAEDAP